MMLGQLRWYSKKIMMLVVMILIFFTLASSISGLAANKISSEYMSSLLKNIDASELYSHSFMSENHAFPAPDEGSTSLSQMAFMLATNVKPYDIRSLLGRELPGFANFDTKIQIAGQGSNFTNLPVESTPPMDVLLNNEEPIGSGNQTAVPPAHPNLEKVVYIYHSHSWESFLPLLPNAKKPNDAVSSNPELNIISAGTTLADALAKNGIGAEHDRDNMAEKLHVKGLTTNQSYKLSRSIVQDAMADEESLKMFIDLHRDSLRREDTTIAIKDKSYARLYFIVGEEHKSYKENLAFAEKLHTYLEAHYPGLSRGVLLKNKSMGDGVYNQDLSSRAMLVEVGGVDNNRAELDRSMKALAEALENYYWSQKNAGQM
ncbi:stage II sporulation protein P [Falsibacillus pallidus]|uniref:Stage II sporulation protein P n=1 Tax=Falsibacillus pallidus TaxID=493781 RepID=A0A370GQH4_9BACI|nr:stage II sporulation protein P [Falsibacillus pallidus]RDI45496.1 stage II sporulation protein P [Falsibacillus pallidus]